MPVVLVRKDFFLGRETDWEVKTQPDAEFEFGLMNTRRRLGVCRLVCVPSPVGAGDTSGSPRCPFSSLSGYVRNYLTCEDPQCFPWFKELDQNLHLETQGYGRERTEPSKY